MLSFFFLIGKQTWNHFACLNAARACRHGSRGSRSSELGIVCSVPVAAFFVSKVQGGWLCAQGVWPLTIYWLQFDILINAPNDIPIEWVAQNLNFLPRETSWSHRETRNSNQILIKKKIPTILHDLAFRKFTEHIWKTIFITMPRIFKLFSHGEFINAFHFQFRSFAT